MTTAEMEERLENLDRRVTSTEQILPTLATKEDLKAFATKEDLRGFATKVDLEQLESRQRTLTESVIDRIKDLFDALKAFEAKTDRRLTAVETNTGALRREFDVLVHRLEDKNVI